MSLLALHALLVLAQAENTVLLLRSPDERWRPFEHRLSAELQVSGFDVRTVDATVDPAGDIPSQLRAQCEAAQALAALWFRARPDGQLDAWVADRVTSKAVVRTYPQPDTSAELARLALRSVELLHASLLELRMMSPSDVPSDVRPRRFAPRPWRPHWTFGTGVGAVVARFDRAPHPLLELRLGYAFAPWLTVEAHGAAAVFPADLGLALFRALASFVPPPLRGSVFSLSVVVGTGALLGWMSSEPQMPGVEEGTEVHLAWLISGGLAGAAQLSDGIRVALMLTPGVTVPQIAVLRSGMLHPAIGPVVLDAMFRLEFD